MENQRDYYQPNTFTRMAKVLALTALCFVIVGTLLYVVGLVSNWPAGTGVVELLISNVFWLGGIAIICGSLSYVYGCARNWNK